MTELKSEPIELNKKIYSKLGNDLQIAEAKMNYTKLSKKSLLEKKARFEAELAEINEFISECDKLGL